VKKITLQDPQTKQIRETCDFQTARTLLANGWQIVPAQANVVVKPEAKR
jgi:hypothetical protein